MSSDAKKKQLSAFIAALLLVTLVAATGYHNINRKWVLFRQAEDNFEAKRFSQAIPLYEAARQLNFSDPKINERLGDSHMATGNFEKALMFYEGASPSAELIEKKGALYDHFGQINRAIQFYTRYRGNMLTVNSRLHLARLYERSRKFTEAESVYRSVLTSDVKHVPARKALAALLVSLKRYGAAIRQYRLVLRLAPRDREAQLAYIEALVANGDRALAEERLLRLRSGSLDPYLLATLGRLYSRLGDHERSAEVFRDYLAVFPGDDEARVKLAEVLSWQGKYRAALDQYERVLANRPEDIHVRRKYALTLSWAGEHAQAVKQLRAAGIE